MFLNLYQPLKDIWDKKNFSQPTAIQELSFNPIRENKNIVGVSPTGTGKTLAYVLPLLTRVEKNAELQVLVLAPSQELVQQIAQVFRDWSDLKVQVISGGANMKRQLEQLKNKPEIIVATPGRLKELAQQSKKIKFHQLKTIVIDEADYLLSDEHMSSLREIVKKAPSQTQKLFFSATRNQALDNVEKWFGIQAEYINAVMENNTKHCYLKVDSRKRVDALKKISNNQQAMVFVQSVGELALVYEKLQYEGVSIAALHSDVHHTERKKAIQAFKSKEVNLLLTTDVASRGIDIDELELVVQFDVPREAVMYTHRSGRTGRMGKEGCVITLVDDYSLKELKRILPPDCELTEIKFQKGKLI